MRLDTFDKANGKHYKTINGSYTKWLYKGGSITHYDNESSYKIFNYIKGMDGNLHRVYWETPTLEEAVAYLDRNEDLFNWDD